MVRLVLLRDEAVKLFIFCTCRERGGLNRETDSTLYSPYSLISMNSEGMDEVNKGIREDAKGMSYY